MKKIRAPFLHIKDFIIEARGNKGGATIWKKTKHS